MACRGRLISVIVCMLVFFAQAVAENVVIGQTLNKFTYSCFNSSVTNDSVHFVGGQVADLNGVAPLKFRIGYLPLTSSLLGITDLTMNQAGVHVWPNPCTQNLLIQIVGQMTQTGLIEIYNSAGISVFSTIVDQPTIQFDVTSLATGMYYIVLSSDDTMPVLVKFIKA